MDLLSTVLHDKGKRRLDNNRFWAEFGKNYWEKRPVAFPSERQFPYPSFSESKLFEAVVRKSERAPLFPNTMGLCIGGVPTAIDSATSIYLPRRQDSSFRDYYKRVAPHGRPIDFCLHIQSLHEVDRDLWETVCDYFQPFYRQIGFPTCGVELGLVMGDCLRSPFGVHVDTASVFQIPIIGAKKIRIWEDSYVRENPDLKGSLVYHQRHIEKSILIQGGPGSCLYWPSHFWHTGESDGGSHGAATLIFWFGEIRRNLISYTMLKRAQQNEMMFENLRGPFPKGAPYRLMKLDGQGSEALLKTRGHMALNPLRKWEATAGAHKTRVFVQRKWLEYLSAYAFNLVPPYESHRKIGRNDTLKVDPRFPVLTHVFRNGDCCVAFRRASIVRRNGRWIQSFARTLNRGREMTVQDVIDKFAGQNRSAATVIKTLREMDHLGAFTSTVK